MAGIGWRFEWDLSLICISSLAGSHEQEWDREPAFLQFYPHLNVCGKSGCLAIQSKQSGTALMPVRQGRTDDEQGGEGRATMSSDCISPRRETDDDDDQKQKTSTFMSMIWNKRALWCATKGSLLGHVVESLRLYKWISIFHAVQTFNLCFPPMLYW